ncbi:hypothetical protein URH17368_0415 [Alicyclobacillus hesperidum URH17-3-68]|nr:hypothetical protein URH17368_0415 [Alicyclobacillus hesperidum URH17-3-68]
MQDVKKLVRRFLEERTAENRPFVPELHEFEVEDVSSV